MAEPEGAVEPEAIDTSGRVGVAILNRVRYSFSRTDLTGKLLIHPYRRVPHG